MIFLSLDDKGECIGFYHDGKLNFHADLPEQLNKTWKYHRFLKDKNVEYANLYVSGKDYDEVCPEHLKQDWERLNSKAKAFIRSFIAAKVSLKENCFFDLVPHQFLLDYSQIKCEIASYVFQNYPKPKNYDFISKLEKLLIDIKHSPLKINKSALKTDLTDPRALAFYKKLDSINTEVSYDQFTTKTGRLTTNEDTFPILQLKKEYRKVIEPSGDFFLELDYNAAEVRTFLALSGLQQPQQDIHEWNKNKFGYSSRENVKRDFIAWLYGAKSINEKSFSRIYNTREIEKKYWDGRYVTNYFGRKIESDKFHNINYTIQSTTADLVLRQALRVNKILKNCESHIAFIIHDSIVIDMRKSDKSKINNIIDTYCNTELGKYMCSAKIGKNLGEMKKIL